MANLPIPITNLPSLSAGAMQGDDLLPIVDVHDPFDAVSGTTKRITFNNMLYPSIPRAARTVATLQGYLANNAVFNVLDYGTDQTAIALASATCVAAGGGKIVFADGAYTTTTDLVLGANVVAEFLPGAQLTTPDGVLVSFPAGVIAPRVQIFSTTGTQLIGGIIYPDWWGLIPNLHSPSVPQCQQNTLAFRKACKSFQTEWVAQQAFYQTICVDVAPGLYYVANGWTVPPGVHFRGGGWGNTLFYNNIVNNDPVEPAQPLINIGQVFTGSGASLASTNATGVTSVAPPGSVSHIFLYTEQPNRSAIYARMAGDGIHNIFFSSSSIGLYLAGADILVSDCLFDQCTTGIQGSNASNANLTNVQFFACHQDFLFLSNCSDWQIQGYHSEFCVNTPILLYDSQTGITDILFTASQIVFDVQSGSFTFGVEFRSVGAEITMVAPIFRNLPGYTIGQGGPGSGNKITLINPIFDGLKTRSTYAQSTTMGGIQANGLNATLVNPIFRNLPGAMVNLGGSSNTTLRVDGGSAEGGSVAPLFGITNTGTSTVRIRNFDPHGVRLYNSATSPIAVDGRQVLYLTAPPASGSYEPGDVTFNSTPSSGNPAGWTCTVAGTPGTWKAQANLA